MHCPIRIPSRSANPRASVAFVCPFLSAGLNRAGIEAPKYVIVEGRATGCICDGGKIRDADSSIFPRLQTHQVIHGLALGF